MRIPLFFCFASLTIFFGQAEVKRDLKLLPGVAHSIDTNTENYTGVEVFCYDGKESRPWDVWRTVELFVSTSTDKDDIQYFMAPTPNDAYSEWLRSLNKTTPIVTWLSQLLLKLPVKLLFSPGKTNTNSTLDRLFSAPPSISLDAFEPTCIAISSTTNYTVTLYVSVLSPLLFFITLLGCSLFLAGPFLVSAELFYYLSASGLGVISFALIALIILYRYMPVKRPFVALVTVVGSSALWVGMARRIIDFLADHIYIAAICITVAAVIGFAVGYWYGPPSSPRLRNLISWFIQGLGLLLIVFGTANVPLVSVLLVLACLAYRNRRYFVVPLKFRLLFYRAFPYKRRFLTEEEYQREGREETERQVDELVRFVNSPECNSWELMHRLKNPVQFAKFVSPHTTPVANRSGYVPHSSFIANQYSNLDNTEDDEEDINVSDDSSEDENGAEEEEQLRMETDSEDDVISDDDDS